jgi:glycosyltransferase involved in cell wall biosynthesis
VSVRVSGRGPRVVLIAPELPPSGSGGIASATLHLALGLLRNGCEVHVLTWLDRDHAPGAAEAAGVAVHRLTNPVLVQLLHRAVDKVARTAHRIVTRDPESQAYGWSRDLRGAATLGLVAQWGWFQNCDVVAAPEWGGASYLFRSGGVRGVRVAMLHGSLYSHDHRYWPHIRSAGWDVRVSTWVEHSGVAAADVVMAPSQEAASDARRWLGVKKPISVVPDCIDLDYVDGVVGAAIGEAHSVEDEFRVVFTGRVDNVKGADTLDAVIGLLRQNPPQRPIRVVVVGPCADISRYQQLSTPSADRVTVELPGLMQMDDVLRHLAQAQAYILPSRAETFCMGVLEAMAVGLPILAAPAGAIPDLVRQRWCGFVIDADDAPAYASALRQLAEDHRLRSQMGASARLTVEEGYDSRAVAREWLRVCGFETSHE